DEVHNKLGTIGDEFGPDELVSFAELVLTLVSNNNSNLSLAKSDVERELQDLIPQPGPFVDWLFDYVSKDPVFVKATGRQNEELMIDLDDGGEEAAHLKPDGIPNNAPSGKKRTSGESEAEDARHNNATNGDGGDGNGDSQKPRKFKRIEWDLDDKSKTSGDAQQQSVGGIVGRGSGGDRDRGEAGRLSGRLGPRGGGATGSGPSRPQSQQHHQGDGTLQQQQHLQKDGGFGPDGGAGIGPGGRMQRAGGNNMFGGAGFAGGPGMMMTPFGPNPYMMNAAAQQQFMGGAGGFGGGMPMMGGAGSQQQQQGRAGRFFGEGTGRPRMRQDGGMMGGPGFGNAGFRPRGGARGNFGADGGQTGGAGGKHNKHGGGGAAGKPDGQGEEGAPDASGEGGAGASDDYAATTANETSAGIPCRFGASCSRPDCKFSHPSPAAILAAAKAAAAGGSSSNKPKCRFWPHCANPVCPFFHPSSGPASAAGGGAGGITDLSQIPCKFEPFCTRPNCPYQHAGKSQATSTSMNKSVVFNGPGKNVHVSERQFAVADGDTESLIPGKEGAVKSDGAAGGGGGDAAGAGKEVTAPGEKGPAEV
ncbi:hypothetical protein HDU76_007921, partial [Blyttiomyces sp. JEL0837]